MKKKRLLLTACLALIAAGNAMADDATWTATTIDGTLTDSYFPLINSSVNLNKGAFSLDGIPNVFDDATKTVTFKYYFTDDKDKTTLHYYGGMIGWEIYDQATNGWWNESKNADLTAYQYLVVQLNNVPGFNQELQFAGVTKATDGTYTRKDYGMTLETTKSDHSYATVSSFGNDKAVMNNVMRISFRDASDADSDPKGNSKDNCGQIQFSNIFLTNTLPDWANPVTKTPSANYGTICLPYTATASGAYIYQITGKSSNGKAVYITPYNGLLKAGVPYIYKATTAKTEVNFYEVISGTKATASTSTDGALIGVYEDNAAQGDNYYIIRGDELYKVNSTVAIKNGAYIDLSKVSVTAAKANSIGITDETTGITSVSTDKATSASDAIYTLSGMRVSNSQQKGILIKNGKKYMNK